MGKVNKILLILVLLIISCTTTEQVTNKNNIYQPDKTNLERSIYK